MRAGILGKALFTIVDVVWLIASVIFMKVHSLLTFPEALGQCRFDCKRDERCIIDSTDSLRFYTDLHSSLWPPFEPARCSSF